jgi:uncharacterized small protein (DUF1192 family)
VVEPGKVEQLPQELRPLAEQLLAGAQPGQIAVDVPGEPKASLEQQVKELETRNAALQKQILELAAELKKNQRSAAK